LWDPYNGCHPTEELPEIQELYKSQLENGLKKINALDEKVSAYTGSFENTQQRNEDLILPGNKSTSDSIDEIIEANSATMQQNNLLGDCILARQRKLIYPDSLNKMVSVGYLKDQVISAIDSLGKNRQSIDTIISEAQNACPKRIVLSKAYIDTVFTEYNVKETQWNTLSGDLSVYAARVESYNKYADSTNRFYKSHDSTSKYYNDSIHFCSLARIYDPVVFKKLIDSIQPGDTIPIDTSIITLDDFKIENKGSPDGEWIVILGNPATKTEIRSRGREVAGSKKIRFQNIIFSNCDSGVGMRVREKSDNIMFVNCEFSGNFGHGFEAESSRNVYLENCLFLHNGKGDTAIDDTHTSHYSGLRISLCDQNITARNILVAHNSGRGIDINKSQVSISHATIADNVLDGIYYTGGAYEGTFTAESSIFCYNKRHGIYRSNETTLIDMFVTAADGNRFYLNDSGAMAGNQQNVTENEPFSEVNPMFFDKENDNYRIRPESELFEKGIGYQY
jgi:hypothetical protein